MGLALIVHGGAGKWPEMDRRSVEAMMDATKAGFDALRTRGSVEAVVTSIRGLENSGCFNAGRGAIRNADGVRELDAGIMEGGGFRAGCVGAVRDIENPIDLAYRVLLDTDHVLIVGEGVNRLAERYGLGKTVSGIPGREDEADTVGAVAIDESGRIAVGASTGGIQLKLAGRVGDSAIPGAGLYADDSLGGVALSGIGEHSMRTMAAFMAVQFMSREDPLSSLKDAMAAVKAKLGAYSLGGIAIDRRGRVAVLHNTSRMPTCFIKGDMEEPRFSNRHRRGFLG